METSGEGDVYIILEGNIHLGSVRSLMATLSECAAQDAECVHLLMGTQGGGVDVGIETYNLLRGVPFELVTHNTGMVASIGIPVYLAGDRRLVCPNAQFLLHGITNEVSAGQSFNARWFKEKHDKMMENEQRVNGILVERTEFKASQLKKRAEAEEIKDAKEAVDIGIAHEIAAIDIPPGATMVTLNF